MECNGNRWSFIGESEENPEMDILSMERDRMKEPINRQVEILPEDLAVTFFLTYENWCTFKVLSFHAHDDTFSSSYLWSCKVYAVFF